MNEDALEGNVKALQDAIGEAVSGNDAAAVCIALIWSVINILECVDQEQFSLAVANQMEAGATVIRNTVSNPKGTLQ